VHVTLAVGWERTDLADSGYQEADERDGHDDA